MTELELFHEKVCSMNVEEIEYKQTTLHTYPISSAINFIIKNDEFIEVRFAKNAEKNEYHVLIYKIANRERTLCYENVVLSGDEGNPECNSEVIYKVLQEAA